MTYPLRQLPAPVPAALARRLAGLSALICAAVFLAPVALVAQAPRPQQRKTAQHRPAGQKPAAGQPVVPAPPPPEPVAPPQPQWPANGPPSPPGVTYNSHGLRVVADNSSLSSILNQISTETGAKVEGLSGDERVFGDYGPGQPREVLAQLLSGANYNVLIVGDEALGEPLRVLLSPRPNSPSHPGDNRSQGQAQGQEQQPDDDVQPEPEEQPYQPPAAVRPPMNPQPGQPFNGRPMTPQERMQELQERQREQQMQQQQQPQ